MSCHCKQCTEDFVPCPCPDITQSGQPLVADENCIPRRLVGDGVMFSQNGSTQLTDGSEEQGLIVLNPPKSISGAGIFVRDANGTVLRIDKFNEGDILTIEGNQIVFRPAQQANAIFDPATLRSGVGQLATFICGPNGKLTLGKFDGCAGKIIAIGEDLMPECLSYDDLAAALLIPLCGALTLVPDSETIRGTVVCTENGLRLNEGSVDEYWLSTPSLLYCQNKVYPGAPVHPEANSPLVCPPVSGYFQTETVNVGLSTFEGYSALAKAVRVLIRSHAYSGASGTFAVICRINGVDYTGLTLGRINNSEDSNHNQVVIPIPENKILNIQAIRNSVTGSPAPQESAYIAVNLQSFKF